MTKYFLIINFLFLIILNKSKLGLCEECEALFYIPSESEPIEEVKLLVNETLKINCKLLSVTHDCHSSNIFFQNKDGQNLSDNVKIVDNATIQLFMTNMSEFNGVFDCKYKNEMKNKLYGFGQVAVRVGYKPEILNFSCISINLDMMECTIEQISNPLIINYSIWYGPTDYNNQIAHRISMKKLRIEEESKVRFMIDQFSRVYKYYYIQIDLDNGFGSDSKTYWIDVKRSAKPIIESLSVTDITSKSVNLTWRVSTNFGVLGIEFEHKVKICQQSCTENSSESWKYIDTQKTNKFNQTTFQLEVNLDYAYTWYDIRVSSCVRDAIYDDLWSHANGTIFQTSKRKPDSPPEIAIGGFEILPNNETKIYWKEVPTIKWNANHMTYEIVEVLGNGQWMHIQPEYNYNNTTAKFHGLQHTKRDYQFKIISRNSEGRSNESSIISIPRKNKRIASPNHLKKHLSNSIYTLTWNYSNDLIPDNYTIFWCDPIDEQGTLCGKLLDFAYVNINAGNTFIYNNTHDKKTKIFAISSNRGDETSGMKWFPCSVTENQDMTIFPAQLEVIGATQMNISWSPQCATPLLKGFNISYCPIYNPNLTECNETKLYSEASNSYHIIENLVAYTTYLVKISMFDGKKIGPIVELRKVTDSSQPTVPYDLGHDGITNSTIKLKWNPPDSWNGEPQFYNISYKLINSTNHQYHKYYKIVEKLNDDSLPHSFQLKNLRSYSDYIIKIAGCNPACSNFSNEIKIQTRIGKPDQINYRESSSDTYSWMPPQYKAGNIDFYEILFKTKIDGQNQVIRKIQMKSTRCTPVHKICNKENIKHYQISVRAVNIVPLDGNVYRTDGMENNSYHNILDMIKCYEEDEQVNFQCGIKYNCIAGDWKMGIMTECQFDSDTVAIITIASFCIGLGMLIGLTMVCKKVQQIKDVGTPELPKGLEGIMETKPPISNNLKHNKQNGNSEDEQKTRLISVDDCRIFMDNTHFDGDIDNSYNNHTGSTLSTKQSTTNFLSLTHTNLENPYGYETEAKPIISYVPNSNNSSYDYDGESINHSEALSYDSTQYDSNMESVLTENTNTDSNYVTQPSAPYIVHSPLMTSNGYVRVSDILKPKPPPSSGYVSIAEFSNQNNKPELVKKNILWPENGYVKPKHLVGFDSDRSAN